MSDMPEFLKYLEGQVRRYKNVLEQMFGPFDCRFIFRSIRRVPHDSEDVPSIHFPNGFDRNGCEVDIHISRKPYDHCLCDQATWQIAHECVHLLNPCEAGEVTVLEEGLATWFQMVPKFHDRIVRDYLKKNRAQQMIRDARYCKAWKQVQRCMPALKPAIKKTRSRNIRLCKITPTHLRPYLADVDGKVLNELCKPFLPS